ncbi:hypothetical protein [Candidatus Enterococcus ferrettii]|uniref:hypothetical protein n=1 Tax=Candidatus Enterococcus ferrettii TaxID=2815324 RepID=UPI001A9BB61F|nr:hypothetical protein [Enterococcus sp. 665A]MBO1341647.1 hypothetical protein [Enterococcus sp. 665A]
MDFLAALFENDLHSLDLMKIPILLGLLIVGISVFSLKGIGQIEKSKREKRNKEKR